MPVLILWLIDNTSRFVWCQFWTGFLKQMCGTFCISLVWRVWRDCSCGISKLWYLQDCGLDKLQLELALSCNEKYIYVYIMEAAQIWSIFTVKPWPLLWLLSFILHCVYLNKASVTWSHFLFQGWTKFLDFLITIFWINVEQCFWISWLLFFDQCLELLSSDYSMGVMPSFDPLIKVVLSSD